MKNCNNFKLMNEIKSHKLTKICVLGLIALGLSIPCVKVQENSKRALLPSFHVSDINYVYNDVGYNDNFMLTDLYFDSNTGLYRASFVHELNALTPFYNVRVLSSFFYKYDGDNFATNSYYRMDGMTIGDSVYAPHQYANFPDISFISAPLKWWIYTDNGNLEIEYSIYEDANEDYLEVFAEEIALSSMTYLPSGFEVNSQNSTILNLTLLVGDNRTYGEGFADGQESGIAYVLSHLSEYNLYTQAQYDAYGNAKYLEGVNDASQTLSLSGLVREIFASPVTMFKGIFNWRLVLPSGEVIDVQPIMTFLLTIGIALAVVHLILKIS